MTGKTTIPYEHAAIIEPFGLDESVYISFDQRYVKCGDLLVLDVWDKEPYQLDTTYAAPNSTLSRIRLKNTRYRIDPATLPDWKDSVLSPPPKAPTEFAAGQIWHGISGGDDVIFYTLPDGNCLRTRDGMAGLWVWRMDWRKCAPEAEDDTYIGEHRYHIDGIPLPEGVEL